ncbi:transposase [Pararhizobium sp. BT-229]|uniref:transposase n=1 Tax=Pararhizobium sp. BT-229 TaxID=2986923 RepID=UPI0021F6CB16|nr:transposase [Pararhizobium sp. BT-229]MCV9964942.1 transposase [Pararhizobium sp. BT-229]
MITGIPELNRYLDDNQWKTVSQAIRAAGGKVTDGNRLHVDAVLDLMQTRRAWRDLDFRYGPWNAVHSKFVRWFETGILHGIVMALFKVGLTETWRDTYTEFSHGPSAVSGPQIRPLMAQIARELRKHRDAPKKRGRPAAAKLPPPEGNTYREKTKAYAKKVKAAVKARKGLVNGRLADEDWEIIASRIPDLLAESMNATRRQVEELIDVMRTNKGWAYMDSKAGKWSVAYAKFAKWVSDGTMARLVKCLAQLGLTKDWNRFLVAPLGDGEKSLKMIIGAEAWLHEGEGRTRRLPKTAKKAESRNSTDKTANSKKDGKPKSTRAKKATKAKRATKAAKSAKALQPSTRVTKAANTKSATSRTRKPKIKATAATRRRTKATLAKKAAAASRSAKGTSRKAA